METNTNNSDNPAVVQVQEWLNSTYGSNPNFVTVDTDGIAGNSTCKALVRAIQIELKLPLSMVLGMMALRKARLAFLPLLALLPQW